jgi:hypothetical protein
MVTAMPELEVHNELLGDPAGLRRKFEECGYLFFRDVIDADALAQVRAKYFDVAVNTYDVIDADQTEPLWNGNDISEFPRKVPELYGSGTWEKFVAEPAIHDFFEGIVGEPIGWIPSTEYRLNPPATEIPEDKYAGRHQDGYYNDGVTFYTCWIPLADVPAAAGGLAIAAGKHTDGYYHDENRPPFYEIPEGAIPDEAWRRPQVYHPGDVVIFGPYMPHVGMVNQSDRFRMSMDIRMSPLSAPQPIVGLLSAIGADDVTIDTADGPVTLTVDKHSYLRDLGGNRLSMATLADNLPIGTRVMAGRDGDRALVVRPQKG